MQVGSAQCCFEKILTRNNTLQEPVFVDDEQCAHIFQKQRYNGIIDGSLFTDGNGAAFDIADRDPLQDL